MTGRLDGKVALITGGASGMGAAHAEALIAEGAQVMIADIADEAGRAVAAALGRSADYVRLDVTDSAQWHAAVQAVRNRFGQLNVLVNNAGILNGGAIGSFSEAEWQRALAINLTGPFLGTSAAADALSEGRPASIVNISSVAGLQGIARMHGYTASKYGLRGLTKSTALELAFRGIRVNSIHPGSVVTPMTIAAGGPTTVDLSECTLTRYGLPSEISALVVYLASDESSFSTGAEFVADGGTSAGVVFPPRES